MVWDISYVWKRRVGIVADATKTFMFFRVRGKNCKSASFDEPRFGVFMYVELGFLYFRLNYKLY